MRSRDYFPLGVAVGSSFCNRTQETSLLINNIKNGKHTLLMATRRYGKSSLALHALRLSHYPYVEIDFYMATNEKIIESYILNGVVELIGKTLGPIDKLLTSIKRYVKDLKPKIDIGASIFKLELTSSVESDPASNVKEGLLLLEKLLEEKNKHAVLLMDEFQNVGILAKGKGIEGAIRHVAQKTKHLTFIFSGSNRKLLKTMFEDETRPLYKLCWKIAVKRITTEHYQSHIQQAAKLTWNQNISDEVINKIILFTERHPFYLNKLCDRLWTYSNNTPPVSSDVDNAWLEVLEEEKSDAIKEISLLSIGQKVVINQIAKGMDFHLTSKKTMLELQMTSSSIITALEGLEEKDMIEKEDNQYQLINPVVRYYALKNSVK
jgi:AAA+ ATPase superfamily predicted ATPase